MFTSNSFWASTTTPNSYPDYHTRRADGNNNTTKNNGSFSNLGYETSRWEFDSSSGKLVPCIVLQPHRSTRERGGSASCSATYRACKPQHASS